jgi:hypothetical protein
MHTHLCFLRRYAPHPPGLGSVRSNLTGLVDTGVTCMRRPAFFSLSMKSAYSWWLLEIMPPAALMPALLMTAHTCTREVVSSTVNEQVSQLQRQKCVCKDTTHCSMQHAVPACYSMSHVSNIAISCTQAAGNRLCRRETLPQLSNSIRAEASLSVRVNCIRILVGRVMSAIHCVYCRSSRAPVTLLHLRCSCPEASSAPSSAASPSAAAAA